MTRAGQTSRPSDPIALGIDRGTTALAAALILAGCANYKPTQQTLTVAPDPVDCADGTPGACVRITSASGDLWITRPNEIAGFTYEPGFAYELLVEQPSEASEIEALDPKSPKLIQIVSKEAAGQSGQELTQRLEQGAWRLASVAPSGHAEAEWAASGITAEFDVAGGRLSGFAGCNDYFAALAVTGDRIEVSEPGSTRKACSPGTVMELEQEYLTRIAGATAYALTAGGLELTLSDGSGMAFEPAAD